MLLSKERRRNHFGTNRLKFFLLLLFSAFYLSCNHSSSAKKEAVEIEVYRVPFTINTVVPITEKTIRETISYSIKDPDSIRKIDSLIYALKPSNKPFTEHLFLLCDFKYKGLKNKKLLYNQTLIKYGKKVYEDSPELINMISNLHPGYNEN